jgi:tetratricopeptide (TPR) repeat protein
LLLLFFLQERSKSAVEDCTKAIDLDPEYLRAIVRRAVLHEKLDQLDEALADWKLVLDLHPDHNDAIIASQVYTVFYFTINNIK